MAPLKSSLARTVGKLLGVQKDADLSLRGVTQSNRFLFPSSITATGGDSVFTDGGYKYHVFTTTGSASFVISSGYDQVQYLIVGGGGGTGSSGGGGSGGGGAGGLLNSTTTELLPGSYPVVVGAGGAGSPDASVSPGLDSKFDTFVAAGGGHGRYYDPGFGYRPAEPGGSGGGAGSGENLPLAGDGEQYGPLSPLFPAPAPGQGYPGGPGFPSPLNDTGGGGGGGAGGAGGGPVIGPNVAGAGGIGVAVPWVPASYGTPGPTPGRWFAGGGGAGGQNLAGGTGGAGGGGNGTSVPPGASGTPGTTNTGGGAGGPGNATGTNGGPGIVILRYLV